MNLFVLCFPDRKEIRRPNFQRNADFYHFNFRFLTLKYAYERATEKMKEKGMVVSDEIWGFILT